MPNSRVLYRTDEGLVIVEDEECYTVGLEVTGTDDKKRIRDPKYFGHLFHAVRFLAERSAKASESKTLFDWLEAFSQALTHAAESFSGPDKKS